jgi:phosphomannomutase
VAALLADLLAGSGHPLAELLADLRARTGELTWFETRIPGPVGPDLATVGRHALVAAGLAATVTDVTTVDGVKFWLDGGQWLLLRDSTTESGVRVYGETRGEQYAAALVDAVTAASGSSRQSDREERECRNQA